MSRRDELLALIPADSVQLVSEVVDQLVFLEGRIDELRKLPFIQIDPKNPMRQRNTPAAKMYKEFLQQYLNAIKLLEYVIYKDKRSEDDPEIESPLRKWFNARSGA
jgi:hypothetical protein